MAQMIYETKRDLFTVNLHDATPTATKYTVPTTFDKYKVDPAKPMKSNFATTTRDEYGSYLAVPNVEFPHSCTYEVDNTNTTTGQPGCFGTAPSLPSSTDPASGRMYRPNPKTRLTSLSTSLRFPPKRIVKDKIGPGLYTPSHTCLSTEPVSNASEFGTAKRGGMGREEVWMPGIGRYTTVVDGRGRKVSFRVLERGGERGGREGRGDGERTCAAVAAAAVDYRLPPPDPPLFSLS